MSSSDESLSFVDCLNENKRLKNQLKELKDKNYTCNKTLKEHEYTIEKLIKENKKLKHRIKILEEKYKILDDKYKKLDNDNKNINDDNKNIINDNKELKKQMLILINNEKKREAVFKLHQIDSISNKTFKKEYMIYFNIDDYSGVYVPNISDFIHWKNLNNEKRNFWNMFLKKYPGSDDKNFMLIYKQLNSIRMDFGAHPNIDNVSKEEFDELVKLALSNINNAIINKYKNWIFSFPKIDDY